MVLLLDQVHFFFNISRVKSSNLRVNALHPLKRWLPVFTKTTAAYKRDSWSSAGHLEVLFRCKHHVCNANTQSSSEWLKCRVKSCWTLIPAIKRFILCIRSRFWWPWRHLFIDFCQFDRLPQQSDGSFRLFILTITYCTLTNYAAWCVSS